MACLDQDLVTTKKAACFCQPIKYVLFGFAKRTGSFGPIGRRQLCVEVNDCRCARKNKGSGAITLD